MYEESEFGPLRWMAPESIFKSQYSVKSDVYAFGITVIEVITQRKPFHRFNVKQYKKRLSKGKINPANELPTAPPTLLLLVRLCTQKEPSLRPTFSDIIEMLEKPDFCLK